MPTQPFPSGSQANLTRARLHRLQTMTSALAWSLTEEQLGDIVLQQGIDLLEATAASLSLVRPDGAIEVVAHRGYPTEAVQPFLRMTTESVTPITDAVRGRTAVFIGSDRELAERYEHLTRAATAGGTRAWAAVPMLWEDSVLGCMGLSFGAPRRFTTDEREFLAAIAQQCALALMRISHFSIGRLLAQMTPDELLELRREIDQRLRGDG